MEEKREWNIFDCGWSEGRAKGVWGRGGGGGGGGDEDFFRGHERALIVEYAFRKTILIKTGTSLGRVCKGPRTEDRPGISNLMNRQFFEGQYRSSIVFAYVMQLIHTWPHYCLWPLLEHRPHTRALQASRSWASLSSCPVVVLVKMLTFTPRLEIHLLPRPSCPLDFLFAFLKHKVLHEWVLTHYITPNLKDQGAHFTLASTPQTCSAWMDLPGVRDFQWQFYRLLRYPSRLTTSKYIHQEMELRHTHAYLDVHWNTLERRHRLDVACVTGV